MSKITPTAVCAMMNNVYENLKSMTPEQIKEAAKIAEWNMSAAQARVFKHQCCFALWKKSKGAW